MHHVCNMHLPVVALYYCDLEEPASRKGTIRVNRELSVIHALMDLLCRSFLSTTSNTKVYWLTLGTAILVSLTTVGIQNFTKYIKIICLKDETSFIINQFWNSRTFFLLACGQKKQKFQNWVMMKIVPSFQLQTNYLFPKFICSVTQ